MNVPGPVWVKELGVAAFGVAAILHVGQYTWDAYTLNKGDDQTAPNNGNPTGIPGVGGDIIASGDKLVSMETGIPVSVLEGGQKAIYKWLTANGHPTTLGKSGTGQGNKAPLFWNK